MVYRYPRRDRDKLNRFTLRKLDWASDLVSEPEPAKHWIVPGYIERGDRLIVTAIEGDGKSTWFRQMALQIALGINPFTLDNMTPARVMLLDLENSREQIKNELLKIADRAEVEIPGEPWLSVANWPEGIALDRWDYETAVQTSIEEVKPDIILGGPMYKMTDVNLADEGGSRKLAAALDRIRANCNVAMILEAHQVNESTAYDGKAQEWKSRRAQRPFGSSLWRRWPEYGLCLFHDGTLSRWRNDRQKREWPERLYKDGVPWIWGLEPGACPGCGLPIPEGKQEYCSIRCREKMKKRRQRGRLV